MIVYSYYHHLMHCFNTITCLIIIYNAWTIKNNYISKPLTSKKLIALQQDSPINLLLNQREAHLKYVPLSSRKNQLGLIISLKNFPPKCSLRIKISLIDSLIFNLIDKVLDLLQIHQPVIFVNLANFPKDNPS